MTTSLTDNGVQFADGSVMNSSAQLGMRNLLINANAAINQRAYVSGTATVAANQYTVDRWRVITSGQSLAFAASGNGNAMTAPAGGLEQVIEGANIGIVNAVINWVGTATCTVDGVAKTKGQTVTLVPGTNCSVKFFGGTVSLPQIEAGAVPTPFEFRSVGTELALCQRYYQFAMNPVYYILPVASTAQVSGSSVRFGTPMRVAPTATPVVVAGIATLDSFSTVTADGFTIAVGGAQYAYVKYTWIASAEL